jgi:hypothetical protein
MPLSQLGNGGLERAITELRGGTDDTNCSAEQHELSCKSSSIGSCDTMFTYDATSLTGGTLTAPDQLKNELLFEGGTSNPLPVVEQYRNDRVHRPHLRPG